MMDESTIEFILNDKRIDHVSGVPFTSIVFMLYYGFELKHFLMNISDEFIEKYPIVQHHVGSSSVYLSGSAAQGLYLNTKFLPDARDIDIVTINRKYDIRERCHFREPVQDNIVSVKRVENHNENEDICPSYTHTNTTTCHFEEKYLNIRVLPNTPTGYVLLQKCRSKPLPVQTLDDIYVSSLKTTQARSQYWHELKPFIRQWFEHQGKDSSLFSYIEPHGPAATAYMSGFEMSTPFEVDMVFCVPYPIQWPKIAEEFLYRKRPSGWPSQTLISEIYNDGCTLIPKGSVSSPMEDYEWRISFTGDLKLARSLSQTQRELLHVIKAIISGAPEKDQFSGLVTNIESYQFMNLLYHESEHIRQDQWRGDNLAELLFLILDKYLEHFQKRHMSHYFIVGRNIFEKYTSMSEEELDTVLYTILRIRHDPLGQLLQQQKYLRISTSLYKLVFSPFVDHVKVYGVARHQMYVNTLVRLTKAHILEESYMSANVYARQSLQFYSMMSYDTLSDEDYIDLVFTVAVSHHLVGEVDQTLDTIEKLQLVMHTKSQDQLISILGKENYIQFQMIFARTMIVSLPKETRKITIETVSNKVKEIFHEISCLDDSNLSLSADMINTFLHLGDIENAITIIKDVSTHYSEFSFLTSQLGSDDESNAEVTMETIYDRAEYMRSKENSDCNERYVDGDTIVESTSVPTSFETELQETRQTDFMTSFTDFDNLFPSDEDDISSREVIIQETSIAIGSIDEGTEIAENGVSAEAGVREFEVIYDRQKFVQGESDEDISFTTDDLNKIDVHLFTDYCRMKAFKKLNLMEKATEITKRLKGKMSIETRAGKKVTMEMLEAAYDMWSQ